MKPCVWVSWLLVACGGGGGTPAPVDRGPVAPAGTGAISIDMDGTWRIEEVTRLDSTEPPPTSASPNGVPELLPPVVGMEFTVHRGRIVGADRLPLHSGYTPAQRYLNAADGRFLLFDLWHEQNTSCYTSIYLRAAFGSVSIDRMDGVIEAAVLTTCSVGSMWLMPRPNGSFAVRVRRVG